MNTDYNENELAAIVASQVLPLVLEEITRNQRELDAAIEDFFHGIDDKLYEIQNYSSHRAAAMQDRFGKVISQ